VKKTTWKGGTDITLATLSINFDSIKSNEEIQDHYFIWHVPIPVGSFITHYPLDQAPICMAKVVTRRDRSNNYPV